MENVNSEGGSLLKGSNTLFLGSCGDGFYGHYRTERHIRLGSYIDPWRGREQPKKPSKARPALLSKS